MSKRNNQGVSCPGLDFESFNPCLHIGSQAQRSRRKDKEIRHQKKEGTKMSAIKQKEMVDKN